VSGFFVKQLLLVPLHVPRNNFDFNTIIEEFFDFKGDSPVNSLTGSLDSLVYSLKGSFDSPVYSPPRNLDSPVYSLPRSRNSLVHSRLGSQDSLVYSPQGSLTPRCIHHRGVVFYCFELFLRACHGLYRNNH
jgi:hypothetical protein